MNRERLLNVARALRESKNPDKFDMGDFSHPCGTPACALGHYAAREDLQDAFRLAGMLLMERASPACSDYALCYDEDRVLDHFGITKEQADELFSSRGCGYAETAIEAAEFIERWVEEWS